MTTNNQEIARQEQLVDRAIAVVEQDAEPDVIGTAAKTLLRELTALRASIEAARRELPKMSVHAARWLDVNPEVKGYIDALRAKLAAVAVERDALNKLLLEGRVYICWAWAKKLAMKEGDAGNVRDCLNRINDLVKEPPAYSKPFSEDVP